jgi:hypothetical protein
MAESEEHAEPSIEGNSSAASATASTPSAQFELIVRASPIRSRRCAAMSGEERAEPVRRQAFLSL